MYHPRGQHGISGSTVTICPPTQTTKFSNPSYYCGMIVSYVDRTHRLFELNFSSSPINFHCVYSRYDRAYVYTTHILHTVTICDYKSLDSHAVTLWIYRDAASKLPNQLLLCFLVVEHDIDSCNYHAYSTDVRVTVFRHNNAIFPFTKLCAKNPRITTLLRCISHPSIYPFSGRIRLILKHN